MPRTSLYHSDAARSLRQQANELDKLVAETQQRVTYLRQIASIHEMKAIDLLLLEPDRCGARRPAKYNNRKMVLVPRNPSWVPGDAV